MSNYKTQVHLDNEERAIIEEFEAWNLNGVPVSSTMILAAKETMKNNNIIVRISEHDLEVIKLFSEKEGIPYQILKEEV